MVRRLRAAVVGLGHLGRHHARIYASLEGVELAGLCDVSPAASLEAAAKFPGVPFFGSPNELVERTDLVSIVTPTSSHLEVARIFLERGIPTLVEKPLAADVEDAKVLVDVAEKSGALLQVGHIEEFNPVLDACRNLIQRPRFIEAHRMGAFSGRSLDVDVILDLMIHDLDLILNWVDSETSWIHAVGIPVLSSQTDMASVRVGFSCGTVANLTASRVSFSPQRRMRLFMPERYLRLDFMERTVECIERRIDEDGVASIEAQPLKVTEGEPLRLELESFVQACRTRSAPRVGGRRAIRALKLACEVKARMEVQAW